jgi:hypothetical protein
MQKYLIMLASVFFLSQVMAIGPASAIAASAIANEPLLVSTVALGTNIYNTCIVTPPLDASQQAICAGLYATYLANIQILHIDMLGINTVMTPGVPDPYVWSPYDVCRFDMGNLILVPICGA